jgi:hypothetical protein
MELALRCPTCGGTYLYYRPVLCLGTFRAPHDRALMQQVAGPVECTPITVLTGEG